MSAVPGTVNGVPGAEVKGVFGAVVLGLNRLPCFCLLPEEQEAEAAMKLICELSHNQKQG